MVCVPEAASPLALLLGLTVPCTRHSLHLLLLRLKEIVLFVLFIAIAHLEV